MWNTGNVESADEVLALSWLDHAHPEVTDPESVKRAVREIRKAFPDFHITIDFMMSERDMVALRGTILRTQQDGKKLVSQVMWLIRIANGKMAEEWTYYEK